MVQTDTSDNWDPPMSNPLELCPFLEHTVSSAMVKFSDIVKHSYPSFDYEEMNKFHVQPIENPTNYTVELNGVHQIFVPNDLRGACFGAAHFPLHHGQIYTARILREKKHYWP